VVTGAEAIYADLGHFGTRPIRLTWFLLVLPCLLLNYFGQGALALRDPAAVPDLFFRMAPAWALVPLVALSTCATVIASQAVISGAFSLSRQAVMMGYLPRLTIEHTSAREIGQIYIPSVNWALMLATIAIVLSFRTSSSLAAAYGIAVTSTMGITTVLAHRVARRRWGWPAALALAVTTLFLVADLSFLGANLFKIADGGWVPLAMGAAVLVLMTTWKRGRTLLARRTAQRTYPLADFMQEVRGGRLEALGRVPGTAVYLCSAPDVVPLALVYTTRHHHVLHERVVILTISTDEAPHVPQAERAFVEPLGDGFWRVGGVYGFMEDPDVPSLLADVGALDSRLLLDLRQTTFFLGQETILAAEIPGGMARWREHLFAFLARNATRATRFFGLPPDRVVEVGTYIEM
jgi:KUP system potassium uptake protein